MALCAVACAVVGPKRLYWPNGTHIHTQTPQLGRVDCVRKSHRKTQRTRSNTQTAWRLIASYNYRRGVYDEFCDTRTGFSPGRGTGKRADIYSQSVSPPSWATFVCDAPVVLNLIFRTIQPVAHLCADAEPLATRMCGMWCRSFYGRCAHVWRSSARPVHKSMPGRRTQINCS